MGRNQLINRGAGIFLWNNPDWKDYKGNIIPQFYSKVQGKWYNIIPSTNEIRWCLGADPKDPSEEELNGMYDHGTS